MDITFWLLIVLPHIFMLVFAFMRTPIEEQIEAMEARLVEIDIRLTKKMSALEARQLKLEAWQTEKMSALEARQLKLEAWQTEKMSALEARQLKLEGWQTEIKSEISSRPITMADVARRKQLRLQEMDASRAATTD
jgi:hypothetical protein